MQPVIRYPGEGGRDCSLPPEAAGFPARREALLKLSWPVPGAHDRRKGLPPELITQAFTNDPFEDYPRAVCHARRLTEAGGGAKGQSGRSAGQGTESFLRRLFPSLAAVPGISFAIGQPARQPERRAFQKARARYEAGGLAAQAGQFTMRNQLVVRGERAPIPGQIAVAGEGARKRFVEFFTANIRNRNTRAAYLRAVSNFFQWCEEAGLAELRALQPVHVAAYVEQLGKTNSAPSVKQHLAAVRMLFDWLVVGQVVTSNPASVVRGPKHVVSAARHPCWCQRKRTRCSRASPPTRWSGFVTVRFLPSYLQLRAHQCPDDGRA